MFFFYNSDLTKYVDVNILIKRIRVTKHPFKINFFFTIWTCLFFANNAPSSNTKLMKSKNVLNTCIIKYVYILLTYLLNTNLYLKIILKYIYLTYDHMLIEK